MQNDGSNARIIYETNNSSSDTDYEILYSLSKDEFGLFGFSTMLADSIVYDKEHGGAGRLHRYRCLRRRQAGRVCSLRAGTGEKHHTGRTL